MGVTTRAFVRELIMKPDVGPLAALLATVDVAELGAYVSVICGRLLARRFATHDDVRIAPYARRIAGQRISPEILESLIRASLGRASDLDRVPAEQIIGLQVYVIRELIRGSALRPPQMEELLTAVEPLVRETTQRIAQSLTPQEEMKR